MEVIGIKLQKAVLIMMSIVWMLGMSSCEDRLDTPRPSTGGGKTVEVSLCVGIADEVDAGSLEAGPPTTKVIGSGGKAGFDVQLVPASRTKAGGDDALATVKPDKLYGLEVWQYDTNGNFKSGKGLSIGDVEIGSSFTVTLDALTDCQLVIIARGKKNSTYTVGSLSGKSLSEVQGTTATASAIEGITASAYETDKSVINAMPYILHLPKVKVVNDGGAYKIQSPDGTDIRILLRRLATRLTLDWKNFPQKTGYELEQVLLQSIPVEYKLLRPENTDTYPSLLDQYATIQVENVSDEGRYSCWIPSLVRGESTAATSDYYRTKANAPKGSAYATFISRFVTGGGGYVGYVAGKGKKHTFNLAESFAREKSGGKKVTYTNPIAVAKNGGWRYGYGNMFYVELVNQYLTVAHFDNATAQAIMNEALKYQGWKYVYGGSNPNTSFDCSGLTQWCYGKAGISLPRTAQAQYDATQHLPLSQAKAGDLVFFHSTYNAGTYVTHVAIYVGNNQMYHAGDPIGYTDLSSSYWQQHLIGVGRVKQ